MLVESSKVLRRYKAGYEVREEVWKACPEDEPTTMIACYSALDGAYIGNTKTAYRLCQKRGIAPEKSDLSHSICSIGFCEKEQKWYGWSHRAIYGFGIGSEVKRGDCGFVPSNRQEYFESLKDWYADDEMYQNFEIKVSGNEIVIEYDIVQRKTGNVMHSIYKKPLDIDYARGEWTAKTLEDARQMAIDFANGVS